eukprot:g8476.t1 g8476   contig3:187587-189680(-)
MTAINLQSCPPDVLALWLLEHRFENNATEVASFLLQCTSTLPNVEEISAQLLGGGDDDEDETMETEETKQSNVEGSDDTNDKSEEVKQSAANPTTNTNMQQLCQPLPKFTSLPPLSLLGPRGKFTALLHTNGIIFTNPKKAEEVISIAKENVESIVWFRKPEDYKKLRGLSGKGRACRVMWCDDGAAVDGAEPTEEDWWNGIFTALCPSGSSITRVNCSLDKPSYSTTTTTTDGNVRYCFKAEGATGSTTTTEEMPFVGCYHGMNDGALFPLREGLLFFKPPLFVPRSKLASISCGRGSGNSRYVDMAIQLDSDDSMEFTNIHRDELGGLNDYIHTTLIPAMHDDVNEDGSGGGGDDDDGSSDEEVVAAEVVASDDNDSASEEEDESASDGGKRRRPSRAASESARVATRAHFTQGGAMEDDDSEDDEEDFDSGEEDGSDSGGSDSSDFGEEQFEEESLGDSGEYSDGGRDSKKARVD